jgi:3-oxoacyl-[acyl-carrier protein] reductase
VKRLADRPLIVTGASSGIGRAIALACAAEGASVLATGRRADALAELEREAVSPIRTLALDLSAPGAADRLVAHALERLGGIYGLVHAAGTVLRNEDVRETPDERFEEQVLTNLAVPFRLTRAVLRALRERGAGGSIVLVGSQLAHVGVPGYASYSAAKGGVTAMVRTLAVDHGPAGIRVNALAPGVVRTPMAYVDRPDFDDLEDGVAARIPLRRVGEPADLAGPAVFLLSDESAWMTGQALVVDGGFTIA